VRNRATRVSVVVNTAKFNFLDPLGVAVTWPWSRLYHHSAIHTEWEPTLVHVDDETKNKAQWIKRGSG